MSQSSKETVYTIDNYDSKSNLPYNKIINALYNNESNNDNNESNNAQHVNILMDYPWTVDKFSLGGQVNGGGQANIDIPHCYAVEYKQLHNGTITNLINSLSAGWNVVTDAISGNNQASLDDAMKNITELYSSLTNSDNNNQDKKNDQDQGQGNDQSSKSFFSRIQKTFDGYKSKFKFNVTNGITSSKYLKPYSLLYWLKPTGKQYVFPMVATPPQQTLTNSYGEQNQQESFLSANAQLNALTGLVGQVTTAMQDFRDVSSLFSKDNNHSFRMTGVEKAKFFQYPTDTEEYTIQFPLINTIRGKTGNNAANTALWIKNYEFIVLFCLKNMIFRKDNAAFYPPLFYDLIIPGVIRQPFCYVSSVQVSPRGMIKQKQLPNNFLSSLNLNKSQEDNSMKGNSVSVPEQWHVTIKFKSLLATSANMVLSSMFELGVESKTITPNINSNNSNQ